MPGQIVRATFAFFVSHRVTPCHAILAAAYPASVDRHQSRGEQVGAWRGIATRMCWLPANAEQTISNSQAKLSHKIVGNGRTGVYTAGQQPMQNKAPCREKGLALRTCGRLRKSPQDQTLMKPRGACGGAACATATGRRRRDNQRAREGQESLSAMLSRHAVSLAYPA